MVKSYCVKQRKQTECIEPSGYKTAKNGRLMHFCTCAECKIKKTKFVKSKQGGALARRKGPNTTDKYDHYKSGKGSPWLVDFKKGFKLLSDPELWSKTEKMPRDDAKKLVQWYKDQYAKAKRQGYDKSYNSFVKEQGWGAGLDIHNAILKVAPKKGFVMPGHRYTGPGNPLETQLKYDPNTGQILEIYQQPTGKTDAVSMQHDVDYSVCGNKPKKDQVKCKNKADRKMVKSLDAIPWRDRQWGHAVARNAFAVKAKVGLGVKKKDLRVKKKTGKKN